MKTDLLVVLVTHPFILLPSTQKTKMTMLDSVKSRGMALAAGSLSLLVLCALCVHMSSSQNQAVSLDVQKEAQKDISSLIKSMTSSIAAKHAVQRGPASMLSTKDYTLSQIKKVAHMIRLAEKFEQVGYLRQGDSLPGMPLQFYEGTNKKDGHYTVRGQCEAACINNEACAAYTYLTETGKCYLKSKVKPGLSAANACDAHNCWYFGVITNRKVQV